MIRKNDILVYAERLEEGDEGALMVAVEDESVPAKVPVVKVRELNTDLPLPCVNVFEARHFKVVGRAEKGDTPETLVARFVPENLRKIRRGNAVR